MDYLALFFSCSQLSSCICDFPGRRDASRTVFRKFRKNLFARTGNQIMGWETERWDNEARSSSLRNIVDAFARETTIDKGGTRRTRRNAGARSGNGIRREDNRKSRRREATKIKVSTIGRLSASTRSRSTLRPSFIRWNVSWKLLPPPTRLLFTPRNVLAWICIVTLFREEAARISRFNKRPPISPSSRRGYSCRQADCKTAGIIRPATSLMRDRSFYPRAIGELLPRLNDAYLFFIEAVPRWATMKKTTTDITEASLFMAFGTERLY